MFLLVYRSSRHATTRVGPAEMCTGLALRLPLDLVQGCPPESGEGKMCEDYVQKLQPTMNIIHKTVRTKINTRLNKMKSRYGRRVRHINFEEGQNFASSDRREETRRVQNFNAFEMVHDGLLLFCFLALSFWLYFFPTSLRTNVRVVFEWWSRQFEKEAGAVLSPNGFSEAEERGVLLYTLNCRLATTYVNLSQHWPWELIALMHCEYEIRPLKKQSSKI